MKIIRRIFNYIRYYWVTSSSTRYINYLRKKGVAIGNDCFFQSQKTAVVDSTRPLLVEIGSHCYFFGKLYSFNA